MICRKESHKKEPGNRGREGGDHAGSRGGVATVLVFHDNVAHNWEDMESAQDFFRIIGWGVMSS